jgi:hypothetical protein
VNINSSFTCYLYDKVQEKEWPKSCQVAQIGKEIYEDRKDGQQDKDMTSIDAEVDYQAASEQKCLIIELIDSLHNPDHGKVNNATKRMEYVDEVPTIWCCLNRSLGKFTFETSFLVTEALKNV